MRFVALALLTLLVLTVGCSGPDVDSGLSVVAAVGPRAAERERMVQSQIEARGVEDLYVRNAMRAVPRHAFVPTGLARHAYEDRALPIGHEQTISQPLIVASMTEAAAIRPGDRVLEIGTGSGYQAAVLAEITPHVFTIEILPPLAERARETLERLGYGTVRCRTGDGYVGWPEESPFDAILVTAAPDEPPPALIEQLRPGGVMVIPLDRGASAQAMVRITKDADGAVSSETLYPVSFVPFTRSPTGEQD